MRIAHRRNKIIPVGKLLPSRAFPVDSKIAGPLNMFIYYSERESSSFNQSASKHGWRTFLYSAMRELVCNGQLWARAVLR